MKRKNNFISLRAFIKNIKIKIGIESQELNSFHTSSHSRIFFSFVDTQPMQSQSI